jgi:hypothetical protein
MSTDAGSRHLQKPVNVSGKMPSNKQTNTCRSAPVFDNRLQMYTPFPPTSSLTSALTVVPHVRVRLSKQLTDAHEGMTITPPYQKHQHGGREKVRSGSEILCGNRC